MRLIHTEHRAGKPIDANGTTILPIERLVRLQPPGMWGLFIWRQPAAVAVQYPEGHDEVIEIQDATRRAQMIILGVGLIGSLLIGLFNKRPNP